MNDQERISHRLSLKCTSATVCIFEVLPGSASEAHVWPDSMGLRRELSRSIIAIPIRPRILSQIAPVLAAMSIRGTWVVYGASEQ